MSYICLKALSLGGMTYQPGEGIPDGAILPSRVRSLTSCGYIAAQGAEPAAEAEAPAGESAGGVLYVPIKGDDELTVPDHPQLDEPSAGYTFTWDMLGNGNFMAISSFEGDPATHAEFVEGLLSTDMRKTSDDLACYLSACV